MKRLSHHDAQRRVAAWQQAANILVPFGSRVDQRIPMLDAWDACNAMRRQWSAIEHVLWTQRHRATHNILAAAAKPQNHRP